MHIDQALESSSEKCIGYQTNHTILHRKCDGTHVISETTGPLHLFSWTMLVHMSCSLYCSCFHDVVFDLPIWGNVSAVSCWMVSGKWLPINIMKLLIVIQRRILAPVDMWQWSGIGIYRCNCSTNISMFCNVANNVKTYRCSLGTWS